MNKTVILKDDINVQIRPLAKKDIEKSTAFFNQLSFEDRKYLRVDVTQPDFAKKRIKTMQSVDRVVAIFNDKIIAEGSLERDNQGWKSHIGEIRLIVAKPFQRKGLGMLIARELYFIAVALQLDEVVAKIMKPQSSAIKAFKRMGFRTKTTIENYVADSTGERQDLVILRCPLGDMLNELQWHLKDSDWQRSR